MAELFAAALLSICGWAAFRVLAGMCRPRRRPLLQPRPEYVARHRATVLIGGRS